MNLIWEQGLDAEVAYRTERLHQDAQPRTRRTQHDSGRTVTRSTMAARRWWLSGSGAWHAAR
ncbi:MAG TPA: hypothetical protein VGK35_10520 [Actinotalea sp.]|jgi:hypothetical protein